MAILLRVFYHQISFVMTQTKVEIKPIMKNLKPEIFKSFEKGISKLFFAHFGTFFEVNYDVRGKEIVLHTLS